MIVQRDGCNDELGCAEARSEAAETISDVGLMPIADEGPTDSNGAADGNSKSANPGGDLPLDCWHHIVQHLNPPSLARAAAGSMQTPRDGKDFRQLCGRWWTGRPRGVVFFRNVHRDQAVNAVKLSRAGGLAAWSVGDDKNLVCTDLTTGQTRRSMVCVGGRCRSEHSDHGCTLCVSDLNPDHSGSSVEFFRDVWDMTALESSEGPGLPLLLTGGERWWDDDNNVEDKSMLQLWDKRQVCGRPIRKYTRLGVGHDAVYSVALDPHHKRVFAGGGDGNIVCWDFETGEQLFDVVGHQSKICALVVGTDCLVSLCDRGTVLEWDLQKLNGVGQEAETPVPRVLAEAPVFTGNGSGKINCIQGMGKGPAGVLAGTMDGRIILLGCQDQDLPPSWSLGKPLSQGRHQDVPVTCLAATDEVVVSGHSNGTLRRMRLGRPFG